MKQKKKWIMLKEEKNGIRIKVSTNITGVDIIHMMTIILCKILLDTAKLNSLDVTEDILVERYKKYMLKYLSKIRK